MPEAITPEFFTARGLDRATAERFAAEHRMRGNARGGMGPGTIQADAPASPAAQPFTRLPPPTPKPTPTAPPSDAVRARAEIAQIMRDRADDKISDRDWKESYERKVMELGGIASSVDAYESAPPGEQNAQRHQWDEDEVQAKFEEAIEAEMTPARSPSDYNIPLPEDADEQTLEIDRSFRQAMHTAGVPRELGNRMAESVTDTARELDQATDRDAVIEGHEAALRARWGATFDAKLGLVRDFLRGEFTRSPVLRQWFDQHPEIFGAPATVTYLLHLAEHAQRRGART